MPEIAFQEWQERLRTAGAPVGAAECHGMLCGALCAGGADDGWIENVLGERSAGETAAECRRGLQDWQKQAGQILAAADMEFTPLLPDDETPLVQRVEALAGWCRGFLFGLSLGRRRTELDDPRGEAGELLHDIGEIARAGLGADDPEQDEAAYAEIVEYLRVGVQWLFEELNPPADTHPRPSALQ